MRPCNPGACCRSGIDPMTKEEAIEALWLEMEPDVYITRDQFMAGLEDWETRLVEIKGIPAMVTFFKGPEFHFASLNIGAFATLRLMRSEIASAIGKHGFLTTKTPVDGYDRQHRLNRKIGCKVTGQDEFFVHYRLDAPCQ